LLKISVKKKELSSPSDFLKNNEGQRKCCIQEAYFSKYFKNGILLQEKNKANPSEISQKPGFWFLLSVLDD